MTAPAVVALPSVLTDKLTALQAKLDAIRKERSGDRAEVYRALTEELLGYALEAERVGRFTELLMADCRAFENA